MQMIVNHVLAGAEFLRSVADPLPCANAMEDMG